MMKKFNTHLAIAVVASLHFLPQGSHAFQLQQHPSRHPQQQPKTAAWRASLLSSSSSDDNTSEEETLSEADRMELVRKLQKSFYQPTEMEDTGSSTTTTTSTTQGLDPSTGIFHQLPLWRVGWVEVPGRANCLNVHEGHYTNMFETILAGPQPWYVGHLCLPGGTKAARTGQTAFQLKNWQSEAKDEERFDSSERSAVVGCLMRITDYRRLEDGRLIMLVHPLERFVVQNTIQQFPFAKADVQLLPDMDHYLSEEGGDENYSKLARAKAVRESFAYQEYEFSTSKLLPLPKDEEYLSTQSAFGSAIAQVLPFAFYADDDSLLESVDASDITTKRDTGDDVSLLGAPTPLEQTLINAGILHFPLSLTANRDGGDEPTKDATVLETLLWLELDDFCRVQQFTLPPEVLQLMPPNLADTLDMDAPEAFLSEQYPVHRRQQRLSYHIPALIEQTSYGKNMRQAWLNTPTTAARLRAVLQRFQAFNEAHMGQFE